MNATRNDLTERKPESSADPFERIQPLNFNAKGVSPDELATELEPVRSAEESCGLCKILLASG